MCHVHTDTASFPQAVTALQTSARCPGISALRLMYASRSSAHITGQLGVSEPCEHVLSASRRESFPGQALEQKRFSRSTRRLRGKISEKRCRLEPSYRSCSSMALWASSLQSSRSSERQSGYKAVACCMISVSYNRITVSSALVLKCPQTAQTWFESI